MFGKDGWKCEERKESAKRVERGVVWLRWKKV